MTLLNTINVGGTEYGITGAAVLGSCATPAGSEVKVCTFSDNFQLKAGDMLLVKFTYANTYGDGSTTYPKLQVNSTNYVMRRADGNYLQSGEWGNNATLTFLFDGTDFILPAGSGAGNEGGIPLGSILAIYTNQVPDGYLPCNGVQFDTAQFAALYALLGDDHTPDLRECTLKMIGENPNGASHVKSGGLAIGEFVDDRVQEHKHGTNYSGNASVGSGSYYAKMQVTSQATGLDMNGAGVNNGRKGDTTEVKAVGVNYVIKATSGLPDSQQDYILNQINTERSYSTSEVATGKTWIDGKPIYRKTFYFAAVPTDGTVLVQNVDKCINSGGTQRWSDGNYFEFPYLEGSGSSRYRLSPLVTESNHNLWIKVDNVGSSVTQCYWWFEYTKTTD